MGWGFFNGVRTIFYAERSRKGTASWRKRARHEKQRGGMPSVASETVGTVLPL